MVSGPSWYARSNYNLSSIHQAFKLDRDHSKDCGQTRPGEERIVDVRGYQATKYAYNKTRKLDFRNRVGGYRRRGIESLEYKKYQLVN